MNQTNYSFIVRSNNCLFDWNKFFDRRFVLDSNKYFVQNLQSSCLNYCLRGFILIRKKIVRETQKKVSLIKKIFFFNKTNFCIVIRAKKSFFDLKEFLDCFLSLNQRNKWLLYKSESVKIYWLSVKFDWFKYLKRGYCKSVKFHWLLQWKSTDVTVKNTFFTDSISES